MYINNSDFVRELNINPPEPDEMHSARLVGYYYKLINRMLLMKNFRLYSKRWKEEMKSEAIKDILSYGHNFSSSKSTNAFSYFTTIVFRAFVRVIKREKKHLYIKFKLMLDSRYFDELVYDNKSYSRLFSTDELEEQNYLVSELFDIQNDAAFEIDEEYMRMYVERYEKKLKAQSFKTNGQRPH